MTISKIKDSYSKLPLEFKREQLNSQIEELLNIINIIIAEEKIGTSNDVKKNLTEDEFLTEEFGKILEIKQKLIDIFN